MKTPLNIRIALIAAILFTVNGVRAVPAMDAERREAAVTRSFCGGDFPRYADGLAALVSKHPAEPVVFLHYRDLFRTAEQTGAAGMAGRAERIREAIRASGSERAAACHLHFTCEMERFLYRHDPGRAKKLTDELRPVRTWTLYGPYRKYGPGDLGHRFQPEVIAAGSEIHPQKRVRVAEADGWLDPEKYLFPGSGVVYAKASFRARETVKLRIFSRSLYMVFVNGRLAARNTGEARRDMRLIVAGRGGGITVLVKLYGAPLEKMRMIVTDGHDAVIAPDEEPDASFSGECDAAEELDFPYDALGASRADDPRKEALIGRYFENLGSDEARGHYRKSLAAAPDPYVSYRLAESLLGAGADARPGDWSEGDGILAALAKGDPSFFPARLRRAEILAGKGEHAAALAEAVRLADASPENPFPTILRLRLFDRMDYEKEFADCAARAAARFPGSVDVSAAVAGFFRTRDRVKYCDALRTLLKRDFTVERARAAVRELAARGDYGAALELARASNFNNDFTHELVEINIVKGDFRAARNSILPALMVKDDPSLYYALGRIDMLQSEDPSMYLQKALDIDPSRHGLSDYLGYCGSGVVGNPYASRMERIGPVDFSWYRKEYAAFPSAVLYRGRTFTLEKDGGSRVFCEDIIQVNGGGSAGNGRAIRVPFRGRVRPVRMRVYDGRGACADTCSLQADGEGTFISFKAPAGDSVLHLSYIVDGPVTDPRGSWLFSLAPEYLQRDDEPVRRALIQVIAPAAMEVDFRFSSAVPVRSSLSGGVRLYSASLADLPPARRGGLFYYSFSTMQGFSDFAAWYGGLVREATGPVPRQAALFRKERLEDTVAGVYDFIAREIESEGTALFCPADAETTLFRKRGTVENKVLCAMALLRGLGITSYIALARDRSLPDAGAYVAHDYFTAILLYVPLDIGHALWLDFSDRSFRCGTAAGSVDGATALVLLENSCRFRKIRGREGGPPEPVGE